MSENVMISKMENNTKQTLTKDDRFSLYVYLDHFVHQFFFFFFLFVYLAVLGLSCGTLDLRSSLVHVGSLQHRGSGSLTRD